MSSKQERDTDDLKDILKAESPRRRWRGWLVTIVMVLVVLAAGFWYFQKPSTASPAAGYRTAEAVQKDLQVIVSATGTLEPVTQVDVSSEISGTVRQVEVDFNDIVKKGQVLAVLDTTKLEAQRDQAKASLDVAGAELESAEAAMAEAKTDLARLQRAYKASGGRTPSRQELDTAKAAYNKAVAQVGVKNAGISQAQASLKAYETDLSKAVITSPIDGLVLDRQIEPGQTVAASLEAPVLFTLAENLTGMSLSVSVDEADVGQVMEGQRAAFTVDAYPEKRFEALLTQVRFAPQDSDGVVTYECILKVDNSDLLLRPGMTASADIITVEIDNALLIPNAALRFTPPNDGGQAEAAAKDERGFLAKLMPGPRRRRSQNTNTTAEKTKAGPTVWLLKDGRPVPAPITSGPSDGVNTQVLSGDIEPGAMVIVGQSGATS